MPASDCGRVSAGLGSRAGRGAQARTGSAARTAAAARAPGRWRSRSARSRASSALQVAHSRPQERHLVDETTIRNGADVAEQGLRHLVRPPHADASVGPGSGTRSRGRTRCVHRHRVGTDAVTVRSTSSCRGVCPRRRQRSANPVIPPRASAQRSTTVRTRPGVPGPFSGVEQRLHGRSRSLGDDLDPAVGQVRGPADQPELERPCPDPPAEPDALHLPVHPGRQPHGRPARARSRTAAPARPGLAARAAVATSGS